MEAANTNITAAKVDAGQGWQWIVAGFALFRKAPLIWIVLSIVLLVIAVVMGFIPLLGQLAFNLLSPVFLAGLMAGCRALEKDEELEIGHLFAGFQKNATPLVTIGGVYLVSQLLIIGVAMLIGGGTMLDILMGKKEMDAPAVLEMAGGMVLAVLVAAALTMPLMMAIWFAPPLIYFKGLAPLAAMRLSFSACLKNIMPFLIYGLMLMVLFVIAAIPFMLGLFVMVPVLFTSIYASYKDIFEQPGRADQPQA